MSDPVLTRTPGEAQRARAAGAVPPPPRSYAHLKPPTGVPPRAASAVRRAVARRALTSQLMLPNPYGGRAWALCGAYVPAPAEAPALSEASVRAYLTGEEETFVQAARGTLDRFGALDLSALLAADLRRAHQALAVLLDALDNRDAERDRLGVTSYLADARLAVARREARAALAAGGIS